MITKCVIIAILVAVILAEILLFSLILTRKILIPYKRKTANMDIEELYQTLELFISNEIKLYEENIFDSRKQIVDNRNFENYYKDLCIRITENLSDDFYDRFSYYMDKDNLIKLICRTVSVYLQKKVE